MTVPFSLRQSIGVLATSAIVAQLLNACLVLVQSHFYVPSTLGFFANVMSVATIAAPLFTMQLSYAIPQQRNLSQVAEVTTVSLMSLSLMLIAVTTISASYWVWQGHYTTCAKVAFVGVYLAALLALYDLGRMLAAREGAFRSIGRQNVGLTGTRALVQLFGGILGGGQLWLVVGEVLGRLISLAFVRTGMITVWRIRNTERLELWAAVRANWRFPLITLPSTFMDNLGGFLPPILLGDIYGLRAAGLYFLAQRVVAFPIVLLTQSTADVIQVRTAQVMERECQKLFAFVLKAVISLFAFGVAIAAALLIFVDFFWNFVFSAQWTEGRELALALIISGITQTVAGPMSRTLIVTNRQALKLIFDVFYLLASLVPALARIFGYRLGLVESVWSMATGYIVANAIYIIMIFVAASRPIVLQR